ncbi:MAG: N-acetyl sugar amidotransferase [Verrucomicrobiota bacterium]|nr:N-acetyl sugar amidotransferase [Verrucomicrobiota bacterium]
MSEYRIKYCQRCVMPHAKPDLHIDEEGVCNACRNFEKRKEIDWDARKNQMLEILERYRNKTGSNYDCIIPSSGGKDSTYQALRMKELGMNPLCVTSTTCKLSEIGRKNIENLKSLGFDYIEVTTNPVVRRKINKLALTQIGDISWPEHVTIFTIPVRVAVQQRVPLLVWGENSQMEYGGPATATENSVLDRRWLEEFGGLLGLRVSDLVGCDGIEKRDLVQFSYPSDEDLKNVGVTGLFLGYFMPWDQAGNALYAQAHGMTTYHKPVEGSVVNYENLDNVHMRIHDYFKFVKYGYSRTTDWVCIYVRNGRLTRSDARRMVERHEGRFPWEYLGYRLEDILKEIDMTVDDFVKVCDRFTNKKLFVCDSKGNLVKDKEGNLKRINDDNE